MTSRRWTSIAAGIMLGITAVMIWAAVFRGGATGPVTPTTTSALTPVTTPTAPPTLVTAAPVVTVPPSTETSTPVDEHATADVTVTVGDTTVTVDAPDSDVTVTVGDTTVTVAVAAPDEPATTEPATTEPATTTEPPDELGDLDRCINECEHTLHCGSTRCDELACSVACRTDPDDPSKWGDHCPHPCKSHHGIDPETWHWPGCTEPPCPPPLTADEWQALADYLGAHADDAVLAELGITCSGIDCACTCGLLCPAKCDAAEERLRDGGCP